VQLNGQQLPFIGTPDDQIDVVMHVAPWAERRMAAWDCHRSQHNPDGAFAQMPDALRRSMAENEHFVLAVARVPLPEGVGDDLLAGLPATNPETAPTGLDVGLLRADLAGRMAYLEISEGYLKNVVDHAFAQVLEQYVEQEQEIIYLLARALRVAGEPAGEIAADPNPIARGARLETVDDRQGFLLAGAKQALAAWGAKAEAAAGPAEQAFWAELTVKLEAQIQTLTTPRGAPQH
jgi:hypothetical protein